MQCLHEIYLVGSSLWLSVAINHCNRALQLRILPSNITAGAALPSSTIPCVLGHDNDACMPASLSLSVHGATYARRGTTTKCKKRLLCFISGHVIYTPNHNPSTPVTVRFLRESVERALEDLFPVYPYAIRNRIKTPGTSNAHDLLGSHSRNWTTCSACLQVLAVLALVATIVALDY